MKDSVVPTRGVAERRAPRPSRWAEVVVRGLLARTSHGTLELSDHAGTRRYGHGDPVVRATVHDSRVFRSLLCGGSRGFGESYVDGWWDSDDLTALVGFVIRNVAPALAPLDRWARRVAPISDRLRRTRREDRHRDRANIRAHYDLGNDFYALMLDETMMYSCAYFADESTSMADASRAKLDMICRKIDLSSADHVAEIGSGWGGFAVHAAQNYGCRVTTVTISDAQFAYVSELVAAKGLGDLVEVRNLDYRALEGTFDKVVSIEMIEAIGWRQLDTYFATCARLLAPGGLMALQAITINDASYERAKDREDFIKDMIFPGGFLPSLEAVTRSSSRANLRVVDVEDIGRHYAETLSRWRATLATHDEEVRALGLGEEFHRMWQMYLCYCEAAFLERHISDVQVILAGPQWRPTLGQSLRG